MRQPVNHEANQPRCDRCGLEITTGMMAVYCPLRERCEFWPHDGDHFIRWMRGEVAEPFPKAH